MTTTQAQAIQLTRSQLSAWNNFHYKYAGISCNENVNVAKGLPNPEARTFLRHLHSSKFGICEPAGKLTWRDVQAAISGGAR